MLTRPSRRLLQPERLYIEILTPANGILYNTPLRGAIFSLPLRGISILKKMFTAKAKKPFFKALNN
jgi:hypothetical protein